jgi:hypothetical protein
MAQDQAGFATYYQLIVCWKQKSPQKWQIKKKRPHGGVIFGESFEL